VSGGGSDGIGDFFEPDIGSLSQAGKRLADETEVVPGHQEDGSHDAVAPGVVSPPDASVGNGNENLPPDVQGKESNEQIPGWFEQYAKQQAELIGQLTSGNQTFQRALTQTAQERQARIQAEQWAQTLASSKPKPPDPDRGTVQDWSQYAEALSKWQADVSLAQFGKGIEQRFASLENVFKKRLDDVERREHAMHVRENERYVASVAAQLSRHTEFAFLRDKAFESDFYNRWYMANQLAGGKTVNPLEVAKSMREMYNKYGSLQATATRTAVTSKSDDIKQENQRKLGVPRAARQTNTGPNNQLHEKMSRLSELGKKLSGNTWADTDLH
jgi:hypothetical protein